MNIERKYKLYLLDLLDINDKFYNLFNEIIKIKNFPIQNSDNSLFNFYLTIDKSNCKDRLYHYKNLEYIDFCFAIYEDLEIITLFKKFRNYLINKYVITDYEINTVFLIIFNVKTINKDL